MSESSLPLSDQDTATLTAALADAVAYRDLHRL